MSPVPKIWPLISIFLLVAMNENSKVSPTQYKDDFTRVENKHWNPKKHPSYENNSKRKVVGKKLYEALASLETLDGQANNQPLDVEMKDKAGSSMASYLPSSTTFLTLKLQKVSTNFHWLHGRIFFLST